MLTFAQEILATFPRAQSLHALRTNVARQRASWGTWSDNWAALLRPLVLSDFQEKGMEQWLEGFAERHASDDSVPKHSSPTAFDAVVATSP